MRIATLLFTAALAAAPAAFADFDLQITEMWPGNEPGENLTEDWFEVTNYGDMAWTVADGGLYFDDNSADPLEAALISGVTSIAPGETVVFIDDTDTAEFVSVWGTAVSGVQLGTYSGSGMSQGGDGATIFVSNGAPLADFTNIVSVDFELYPNADDFGGQSYDVLLGTFTTLGNGGVQSTVANDEGQFAIASPGTVIPEPTALVVLGAGAFGLALRRRR